MNSTPTTSLSHHSSFLGGIYSWYHSVWSRHLHIPWMKGNFSLWNFYNILTNQIYKVFFWKKLANQNKKNIWLRNMRKVRNKEAVASVRRKEKLCSFPVALALVSSLTLPVISKYLKEDGKYDWLLNAALSTGLQVCLVWDFFARMNSVTYYSRLDLRNYPLKEGSCPEAGDERFILLKESFKKWLWFSEAVILPEFEIFKTFLNMNSMHLNDFMLHPTSKTHLYLYVFL